MKASGKQGFTLIEVMCAIVIFMIGAAAITSACVQTVTLAKRAGAIYTAYNLAKNHVETLKTISYDDLPEADEEDTVINSDGVGDAEGTYIRTTVVTPDYGGDDRITYVQVEVDLKFQGAQKFVPMTLTTLIYDVT